MADAGHASIGVAHHHRLSSPGSIAMRRPQRQSICSASLRSRRGRPQGQSGDRGSGGTASRSGRGWAWCAWNPRAWVRRREARQPPQPMRFPDPGRSSGCRCRRNSAPRCSAAQGRIPIQQLQPVHGDGPRRQIHGFTAPGPGMGPFAIHMDGGDLRRTLFNRAPERLQAAVELGFAEGGQACCSSSSPPDRRCWCAGPAESPRCRSSPRGGRAAIGLPAQGNGENPGDGRIRVPPWPTRLRP